MQSKLSHVICGVFSLSFSASAESPTKYRGTKVAPTLYRPRRQGGAMYDANADKREAHGPVTEGEWVKALNVMDTQLEAALEVDGASE